MDRMRLLLVHHAHTDIGYTDRQEKIEWNHVKYLERVINILRTGQWPEFKWVCETLWPVERFLARTAPGYREDFQRFVGEGRIGLSGNYLNFNDLIDPSVLATLLENSRKTLGDMTCAMAADINGIGWGQAAVMAGAGVENLLMLVHTHHGYYATGKKQQPFFWEMPDGRRLFVWQGEHYNLGNEFYINRTGRSMSYMVQDGLDVGRPDMELSRKRIFAYVDNLRREGYAYDVVPVAVSGMLSDNSPPSHHVAAFVREWNALYGAQIELEMVTLEQLFAQLRRQAGDAPVYRGDWVDWWGDGMGSTPGPVKHYREAVRRYRLLETLGEDPRGAAADLALYAEHTWGYSASVSHPWDTMVTSLDLRKTLYAARAHEQVSRMLDDVTEKLGETAVVPGAPCRIRVVNPHDREHAGMAVVYIEQVFGPENYELVDGAGQPVPWQRLDSMRGNAFHIPVTLGPKESRDFHFRERKGDRLTSAGMTAVTGSEGTADLAWAQQPGWNVSAFGMETPFFTLDARGGLHIQGEGLIQPLRDVTPAREPVSGRTRMGRNRKGVDARREEGRLVNVEVLASGPVLQQLLFHYELPGTRLCRILVTGYRHLPRLDLTLQLHKESCWEPENLYLSLPFGGKELWIDKGGAALRPREDQLPGTCADFYVVENGMAFTRQSGSLVVTSPDAPLITMGGLDAGLIRLSGEEGVENIAPVHSWVMNNFWETNFKAEVGGFIEMRYALLRTGLAGAEALQLVARDNMGLLAFPVYEV